MDEITKRYAEDAAFREVADLLYGPGHSLVSKANPDQADIATKKRQRKQAQVGLASNVVGLAAGVGGTAAALRDPRLKQGGKLSRKTYRAGQKLPSPISSKTGKAGALLAGGALGLQVTNIAGDAVANRVLARSAKDPKKKVDMIHKGHLTPVNKSIKEIPESASFPKSKGELTQAVAVKASDKVVAAHKKGTFKRLPEKIKTSRSRVEKNADLDVVWEGEISKVDTDKRQVFGWASIVEMNGEPVVDLQGDYIAIDEVEKSAYEYVHKSRKGGDMHLRDEFGAPKVGSHMIESFVVTEDKKKALGLPDSTPTGWWVGYQVNDDDLWQKVKSGERTGFSIHGRGVRSPAS